MTVHLHKESEKIRIKRGVRQGDTISPKLFTATLESIFRRLNWEHKGVKIDGEFLSNLRFADDIFLCTETPQELQQMLQELSDESRRMGLKMNIAKTKVMVVDNTPININNVLIENVQGYVYLGQHYSLKEKNQDKDIQRRIMAGWAAYAKHRDIFKSNLAICLKRQVYNSCVLPAMTGSALCSPVPMFPGTDVPRSYVPRYRCSPVPMFPEPMFPGTDVPRFFVLEVVFSVNMVQRHGH